MNIKKSKSFDNDFCIKKIGVVSINLMMTFLMILDF